MTEIQKTDRWFTELKKNIPLYKQIEENFINQIEIGTLKSGDRVPSEAEIVNEYHVSQITAKNALNNLAEKGYVKRIRGKGTFVHFDQLEKQEHIIGIIFTTISTYIDKELLDSLEKYAQAEKIRFFFGLSRESMEEEIRLMNYFVDRGVEGLIIFPTESEKYNEEILKLHLEKFPLVLIDRYFSKLDINSVSSDNFSGGYKLADLLIKKQLAKTCVITTKEENSATIDRQKGIEAAYVANKIPINKNLWLAVPSDIQKPQEIIAFLKSNQPESVITINAHLSELVVEYTQKAAISHLSFDNPVGCDYYIKQNTDQIAKQTIQYVKEAMSGKTADNPLVLVPVKVERGQFI